MTWCACACRRLCWASPRRRPLAAESIAIERGVATERIAETEGLALHAGAFNGIPDPVFHLTARAMGIVTGLAAIEPHPDAPPTATPSWTPLWSPQLRWPSSSGSAATG